MGPTMVDTVFALSSGTLPSGVAIIRMSGPSVRFGLETLCRSVPEPRTAVLLDILDADGSSIDKGLVLYFPGPRSFTGEDCAELHVHGSKAVVRKLHSVLGQIPGFRPAEAGEFTKRAFLSGKIDLTAAEGLSDLLAAETETQRKLAISLVEGGLDRLYSGWREKLTVVRAMAEALIEFSDEDDVAARALNSIIVDLSDLKLNVLNHLARAHSTEIVRDGFQVAIVGAPNAGKSSLLNAMAQRDVAIVSDEAGTTRDVLEARLDVAGQLVVVADTAGIRSETGKVEAIGISKAFSRAKDADLVLQVYDGCNPVSFELPFTPRRVLNVGTNADRISVSQSYAAYDIVVSSVTGSNVSELISLIGIIASEAVGGSDIGPVRHRQVKLLNDLVLYLDAASSSMIDRLDVAAEQLRQGSTVLGKLTGVIDVEDLLDVIFSSFCIGK